MLSAVELTKSFPEALCVRESPLSEKNRNKNKQNVQVVQVNMHCNNQPNHTQTRINFSP